MNNFITDKSSSKNDFKLAFNNLWKNKPYLKDEPIMYMCSSNGYDYFKHSITRESYKIKEG